MKINERENSGRDKLRKDFYLRVEKYCEENGMDFRKVKILTKEKRGRLDCSPWEGCNEDIDEMCWELERMSEQVCDMCGMPGETRNELSWVRTLCDKCLQEHTQKGRGFVAFAEDEKPVEAPKKGSVEYHKTRHQTFKELTAHYKELWEKAMEILKKNKVTHQNVVDDAEETIRMLGNATTLMTHNALQIEHLLSVIDEVVAMTDDRLAKKILENGVEKHNLDRLVSTRIMTAGIDKTGFKYTGQENDKEPDFDIMFDGYDPASGKDRSAVRVVKVKRKCDTDNEESLGGAD